MAEDNPRNLDPEVTDLRANYNHTVARDYIKHTIKNKSDTFFSGEPITTTEGVTGRAIINLVLDRNGIQSHEIAKVNRMELHAISEEIVKQMNAEVVRSLLHDNIQQSLQEENPYEKVKVEEPKPIPQFTINEELHPRPRPEYNMAYGEENLTMREVRQQFFDKLIDKAVENGADPTHTPVERCLKTVRDVIEIIDGGVGNRPDGEGLPLMQLILSPHPEFLEGRQRKELPGYDDCILDQGLIAPNAYQTGMARAFERHYDTRFASEIKDNHTKAASALFGGK